MKIRATLTNNEGHKALSRSSDIAVTLEVSIRRGGQDELFSICVIANEYLDNGDDDKIFVVIRDEFRERKVIEL